jgi:hypothetical protein
MLITQEVVTRFEEEIGRAEGKTARLAITGYFQRLSSIQPVHHRLKHSIGRELSWDDIKALVAGIPVEKQQRFSVAIKYLQKSLEGHGSHMFETLKTFSSKVSKSQQRYMLPMLHADSKVTAGQRTYAEVGLCLNLAMLWLKEQFDSAPQSAFERLGDKNVIGSKKAYEVAKQAATMVEFRTKLHSSAEAIGLSVVDKSVSWSMLGFDRCADHLRRYPEVKALLIAFFGDQHAVSLFRESPSSFLFFDANAGSYRVSDVNLRAFLNDYNNVCLPKKWPATPQHPAFSEAATLPFTHVYTVDKLRR